MWVDRDAFFELHISSTRGHL